MLASHITGAFWSMLPVERNDTCWRFACKVQLDPRLSVQIIYWGSKFVSSRETEWIKLAPALLKSNCSPKEEDSKFNYGIYCQAIYHQQHFSPSSVIVYHQQNFFLVESFTFLFQFFICFFYTI